tara:strand:+ start:1159 stop:1266 length:108 start_codon:yes stop_codon:yes gene_type:complete
LSLQISVSKETDLNVASIIEEELHINIPYVKEYLA